MPESLSRVNFIKKEALAQVLSCEFYKKFKSTFIYRRPVGAAHFQVRPSFLQCSVVFIVDTQAKLNIH